MSVPVVFADLYKPVKDFFSKGYVNPTARVEVKAKGADGYVLVTAETSDKGTANSAEFEKTMKLAQGDLVEKIVLTPGTRFQPSLKLKNAFGVKSFSVGVNADQPVQLDKKSAADKIEFTAEYNTTAHYTKALVSATNSFAEISSTVALSKILVGGSVKAGFNGALANYTAGVSYKTPLLHTIATFTQVLKDKSYTATVGGLYNWNKWIFGGQVVQTAKGSAFLVGGETWCFGSTWRGKINNKGVISTSTQQKYGNVVGTVGGDFDTSKLAFSNVGLKFVWEQ